MTKEQILEEGWLSATTGGLDNGCLEGKCAFLKGNYMLIWYKE